MGSWFASLFITYLLCSVMMTAAGQTGTSDLESECGILMKLESLESRIHDQETNLRDQDTLITELKSRIQEQETNLRDQKISILEQNALITELKSDMTDKENRIDDLEADVNDKDNRISNLEAGMTDKDNRISDLESGMTDKDNRIIDLDTRLTEKEARIDELQTALSEQEAEIANLNLRPTEPVQAIGFTARAPKDSQTTSHQMAFKTVVTNEGGAFNASTGVFTCPVAGYYYFSAALLKYYSHDGEAGCRIFKNGGYLAWAYTRPGHTPRTGLYAAVTAAYTRLAVNDNVTLGFCITPIETVFNLQSTFTGFLVTPDG